MTIKEIKEVSAQGDVLMFRIAALPSEAMRQQAENGLLIVTHSETGHHHAVEARPGIELYMNPKDPLVGWLRIEKKAQYADVVHHRPWDTHETQRLLALDSDEAGEVIWEIRRQRENSPEGWRRVVD